MYIYIRYETLFSNKENFYALFTKSTEALLYKKMIII